MGCSKDTLSVYVDTDVIEAVEAHREERGMEKHEALAELVETGRLELRSPLLYRAKQQSKDVAFYLPLVAATVAIVGTISPTLTPATAYQIGGVLLAVSLTPLAAVEVAQRVKHRLADMGVGT